MQTEHGTSETLVNPEGLRQIFADEKPAWNTGLIQPDLLYVGQDGDKRLTVSFRSAQKTGVWLDGEPEPIRVPLPPLVLFKVSQVGKPVSYKLFAVTRRPRTGDESLYVAPLPNVYADGKICWGSVARPIVDADAIDMTADWNMLLGSGFNDHSTGYKSYKYEDDIRKMLRHVRDAGMGRYPLDDLRDAGRDRGMTFNTVLGEML